MQEPVTVRIEPFLTSCENIGNLHPLGLIVVYKNEEDANKRKVHHYELCVQRYSGHHDVKVSSTGGYLSLPKIDPMFRVKIRKQDAKKLIADGMRPSGAFFLNY